MSRSRRIGVLDFRDAINSVFVRYGQEVNGVLDSALQEVTRESCEDLKAVTTWRKQYASSPYSKDWTWSIEPAKRLSRKVVVYNADHYQLTHLLESGHAKYLWGRDTGGEVQAFPHIKPIADKAYEHLDNAVIRRLERIDV